MVSHSALPNMLQGRSDALLNLWNDGSTVAAGATATSAVIDFNNGASSFPTAGGDLYTRTVTGAVVLNLTVATLAGGGDTLTIQIQYSNAADFGSGVLTKERRLLVTADNGIAPRPIVILTSNQDNRTNYRYMRVQIVSASSGAGTFGGYMTTLSL